MDPEQEMNKENSNKTEKEQLKPNAVIQLKLVVILYL